jgi:NADH:ubiquinone oxidoreductase subunit F (NADH-binding)
MTRSSDSPSRADPAIEIRHTLTVCRGPACCRCDSLQAFESELGITEGEVSAGGVLLETSACLNHCAIAPVMQVDDKLYRTPESNHLSSWLRDLSGGPFRKLVPETTSIEVRTALGAPAISLRHFPKHLADFKAARVAGIYDTLLETLAKSSPKRLLKVIHSSGICDHEGEPLHERLRAAHTPEDRPTIMLDAAATDPGSFADRVLLERDPHSVLEGLLLTAFAAGAPTAIVRIHARSAAAIRIVKTAIEEVRAAFARQLPYALEVLEAHSEREQMRDTDRFIPRVNAETMQQVGCVALQSLNKEAYSAPGTKLLSLSSAFARPGLCEVPLGVSVRAIVEQVCEDAAQDFKAVQIGGPAGMVLTTELWDTPLTHESLRKHGGRLGSGGIVGFDSTTAMLSVARNCIEFGARNGCGLCVPCRLGTRRALVLIGELQNGDGTSQTLAALKEVCATMGTTALCAAAKHSARNAGNILKYFHSEILSHNQA